ncbi:MAG: S24 family peptidase [Rikenellaceae bacterium]|nr:S24 family peptidase [Rikenellaceae bacterium]
MLTSWQRLEKIIKWTGLSVNAFARNIGLKRSENLYQIKKGNNGISRELADIITTKYPMVSKAWVLTGEGEMFLDAHKSGAESEGIPFYNIDAISIYQSHREAEPLYYIAIPIFDGCDFAARCMSNAMTPDIPPGAIIVLKEIDATAILPGETYLVVTGNFCGVRIIRRGAGDDQLRLVPRNVQDYDEITLDPAQILKLFAVKGVIINKIL